MGATTSTKTYFTVDEDYDGYQYMARFGEDRIGEGEFCIAYSGTIASSHPRGGPRVGFRCAVKVFKAEYARNYDKWVPRDLVAHKRAARMAASFNKLLMQSSYRTRQTIEVLTPLIARVEKLGGHRLFGLINVFPVQNVHVNEYVSLEPFLDGYWQKFNSNGGWCNDSYALLQAFSHWSACKSRYLLCDLQGVVRGDKYLITDPCVHSEHMIHGPTDSGVVEMEKFLAGHRCNYVCRELGLWRNPVPYRPSHKFGSTYSFQLTSEERYQNSRGKTRYLHPMMPIQEQD